MLQPIAEREADIARFKKAFGGVAPEFSAYLTWGTSEPKTRIPFQLAKLGKDFDYGDTRVVFEARYKPSDVLVRVDYAQSFGLSLRRQVSLHEASDSLISGEVSYQEGELKTLWSTVYASVFLLHSRLIEKQLSDPHDFDAGISIVRSDDQKGVPPLAQMDYTRSQRIPLHAEFPYASYREAIAGSYDIRHEKYDPERPYFRTTYFQWESLVGAKVGMTSFRDENDSNLSYNRWVTAVNTPRWTSLEDTPYAAKITHAQDLWEWGSGRLRFHRKDNATGELWYFSVPEWLDKKEFIRDLKGASLRDFHRKYRVAFYVQQSDREKLARIGHAGKYDRVF